MISPFFAMGLDPISWVYIILFVAAAGVSYNGMQKAKRAAQSALERTRGLIYQSRAAAFPRRIIYGRRRVGGLEVYLGTSGVKNEYMHWIFYWCEGPINAVSELMFNGEALPMEEGNPNGSDVVSGKYYGFATARHRRGDSGNLLPPDEPIAQMPGWASTDLGLGCAWSWVRIKYDEEVFANGFPDVSAIIEGRNDVLDPRDDTLKYTTNPGLCFNHYMTLPRLGPNIDYDEEMHETELIACANVCDEDIVLSDASSEKRYTINEVFSLEMDPESIIESFRSSMAGAAVYVSGRWRFYAGAYIVPTFEITKSMLVEEIRYRSKTSKRGHYNTIKGTYVSEANGFQPTDFSAIVVGAYVTEDGEELTDDLDLSGTNSSTMARRIARIELDRLRRARTVSCVLNIEGIRALPGRPVKFHFPEADPVFDHLPMDVLEYNFSIENNVCKVALLLRETDPDVYDDNSEDKNVALSSRGDDPTIGPAPGSSGGPGPNSKETYLDFLDPVTPTTVAFNHRERGGTYTRVGWPGFVDPTVIYRRKVESGTSIATYWANNICTVPFSPTGNTCTHDSVCQFDATTGLQLTTTGAGLNCTDGAAGGPQCTHPSTASACGFSWSVTQTEISRIADTSPCCDQGGGRWAKQVSDSLKWTLSDEDTETDALNRLKATFDDWADISWSACSSFPCGGSSWEEMNGATSADYSEGQFQIISTGLYADAFTLIIVPIYRTDLVTMVTVLQEEREFEVISSITGTISYEFDFPNEAGFAFTAGTPTHYQLTP